jgi:phospholipid/cholesterol/gamma-HCH transport system permease protein
MTMPDTKDQNSAGKFENEAAVINYDRQAEGRLLIRLEGSWKIGQHLPAAEEALQRMQSESYAKQIAFDTQALTGWDSRLLTFLTKIKLWCSDNNIAVDAAGLPEGVRRLLRLAAAVPEREGARRESVRDPLLPRVGASAINMGTAVLELLTFIGEAFAALLKLVAGRARFRPSDLGLILQDCSANALPIVTLISLLVGLILASAGGFDSGVRRRGSINDVWCSNLCCRSGGHRHAAGDGRHHGRHYHGRPHRCGVCRANRHDAGQ